MIHAVIGLTGIVFFILLAAWLGRSRKQGPHKPGEPREGQWTHRQFSRTA